jgi:hypothetical protein
MDLSRLHACRHVNDVHNEVAPFPFASVSRHVQVARVGSGCMEQTVVSRDRTGGTPAALSHQKPAQPPAHRNRSRLLGERGAG